MTSGGSLSGRQPRAVQSALRILEEAARFGSGVTAKDIATNLSMPPATTYRLLNILVAEGYLVRLPDLSGFALGVKVAVLVDAAVSPSVSPAAHEVVENIRRTVRFGVHLYRFTTASARAADLDPQYPPPVDETQLNRYPHGSAVGKLLLAEKDDPRAVLGEGRLVAVTVRTINSMSDLHTHLDAVRTQGFAIQVGELRDEWAGVAVPVRTADNRLIAAVAVSGESDRADALAELVTPLRGHAEALARLLT